MAMNAMDTPGLARFWNGLKAKLNSKADLVDGKVPASQLPASSGYAPVVLTCTISGEPQPVEGNPAAVCFVTQLTSGTFAEALAAAEAGTPAGLLVHIQQTETDPDTDESTTYSAGSIVVPLASYAESTVDGVLDVGEGASVVVTITSDNTVDVSLITAPPDSYYIRAECTVAQLRSGSVELTPTEGDFSTARQAAGINVPVFVRLSVENEAIVVDVPLRMFHTVGLAFGSISVRTALDGTEKLLNLAVKLTGSNTLTVTTAELGSGGDSAVYIDVTMEYLNAVEGELSDEATPISLPSGTYTTAAAAIASGRDVKVRLTLHDTPNEGETPITFVQQTIPLRRVQLDTGAALAANTAGDTSTEDETTAEDGTTTTPDVSAYYSIIGDVELNIDFGAVYTVIALTVSGGAPISYVVPVPVRIVVQQDDTAEFAIQFDRWHLTVPVQLTALADDVNVGTEDSPQTVAAYKTQNAVDAVYRTDLYLDGQAREGTFGVLGLFALVAGFTGADVTLYVAQMSNSNSSSSKGWRIPLDGSDFIAEGKLYRARIESSLFLITEKAVTL